MLPNNSKLQKCTTQTRSKKKQERINSNFSSLQTGYHKITANTSNVSPGAQVAPPNEIQEYIDARYLSTCEALWRAFEYDIHFRVPSVERLVVHLPGLNHVRYEPGADLHALLASSAAKNTMLTEWFETNLRHEQARCLTYCDFPKKWTWDASAR
jgi:hypothetical protein